MASRCLPPVAPALAVLGMEEPEQLAGVLMSEAFRAAGYTGPAGHAVEDLLSEGFIWASRALATYDPTFGVPFSAYYRILLRRRFSDLGSRKRLQTSTDLTPALAPRARRAYATGQLEHDVRDVVAQVMNDSHLAACKGLAFYLYHLEGWTLNELAQLFGKSMATLWRWIKQAEALFKRLWQQGEDAGTSPPHPCAHP